ncbi:glycerophosphodiester phosphodiesterase family protein [Algoriphagus terrigena]|uniref:glycerophosphodiester phosphodiesterase family protein n=1 Tax=Algoriphagus terrigena TaxID=344884 RepID=UPI000414F778|nr:glycerophosphodiester phosphodiesterase family protein [Algoriphagus terrigena]
MSRFLLCLLALTVSFTSSFSQEMFHKNSVIAHRGAWKAQGLPQNSLASLDEAVRLKCEGSEFDVWMTADGILVVNHDAEYLEMPIETSTFKELRSKKLPNGEKIPTVKEYLKKGMKQTGTKLILEIKPSKISVERSKELAAKCVDQVKELKAEKWVDYITFSYDAGIKVIELDPKANVAYLNGEKSPAELKEAGFFGFDYNIRVVKEKPQWIKEAQDLGLTVNVWTVNKVEDMQWLLDQKVDFITTDEPELLFETIGKR